MKQFKNMLMAIVASTSLAAAGVVFAEDIKAPAAPENHEQHHPEGPAKDKAGAMSEVAATHMTEVFALVINVGGVI